MARSLVLLPLFFVCLAALGCPKTEDTRPSRIAFAVDRKGTNRDILLIDPAGGEPQPVSPANSFDESPAWSPDGFTLLFASGRDHHNGIYSWEDGKLGKILMAVYRDCGPSWSPDGRNIAFMSDRDDSWEIYVVSSNGKNEKRLTNDKASDTWPAWSPDGTTILFLSDRGGQQDIYSMKPDGTDLKPLTNDRAWDGRPAWSPDGKWIAWPSMREGKSAIFVMDAAGKNVRRVTPLTSEADEPTWSPDGKRLAFASTRSGFRELWVANAADGSSPKMLTHLNGMIHTPAWSPFLPPAK